MDELLLLARATTLQVPWSSVNTLEQVLGPSPATLSGSLWQQAVVALQGLLEREERLEASCDGQQHEE